MFPTVHPLGESIANISGACFFSHGPVDRKSKQPSHFTVRYGIRWPIAFDDLMVIIYSYDLIY